MTTETKTTLETWAIVSLFGHNTIAGYLTEQSIAGAGFIRIDVPAVDIDRPAYTKFYGPTAVYDITPVSEEIAKVAAQRLAVRPVDQWVVPEPKPRLIDSHAGPGYLDSYGEDDSDEDEEYVEEPEAPF